MAPVTGPAIEMREAAGLAPYAQNARTHSPEQIAQLKASFRRFGFNTPLGVDGEGILVGHGRLQALQEMWADGEDVPGPGKREPLPRGLVPTLDLSGLSAEERRAYIIADNQLALNAGWDMDMLVSELRLLDGAGFELETIGFDPDALADMLATPTEGLTDPDAAPPLPANPITRAGDLWVLGANRLLCGDSTSATDVERLLDGAKPNVMATDPPYGVEYDPNWRNEALRTDGTALGARAVGKVSNDDRADWREAWALFPGNIAYVWHGGVHAGEVAASLEACRLLPRAQIVWVKTRMAIGRGHYHWQHEPAAFAVREGERLEVEPEEAFEQDHGTAAYAVRKGKTARWRGGRKQTTVWFIDHLKNDTGHGTQKPVECMRRPILNHSAPGEAVYEPFSGSGTTIIAGESSARPVLAMEIDPAYVDVAVIRWQQFTGKAAILEGDGRTFDQLVAEREGEVS